MKRFHTTSFQPSNRRLDFVIPKCPFKTFHIFVFHTHKEFTCTSKMTILACHTHTGDKHTLLFTNIQSNIKNTSSIMHLLLMSLLIYNPSFFTSVTTHNKHDHHTYIYSNNYCAARSDSSASLISTLTPTTHS